MIHKSETNINPLKNLKYQNYGILNLENPILAISIMETPIWKVSMQKNIQIFEEI